LRSNLSGGDFRFALGKMLNDIEVLDQPDTNYWMKTAYTIPDTPHASIKPGQTGVKFANQPDGPPVLHHKHQAGRHVAARRPDAGARHRVRRRRGRVAGEFSSDGSKIWQEAQLGTDEGKYSFRQWQLRFSLPATGERVLMVRCTSSSGEVQPNAPNWNPAGFMCNVVEQTTVVAA
jgi:hypothetical protein